MKTKRLVCLLLAAALLVPCAADAETVKRSEVGYYLNTVITLTAYVEDPQVLKDALEECGRYERLLSRTVEGSDVWRINHAEGQPVEVSDDTIVILRCAVAVSEASGGAFDATIAPASTLWDFTSGAAVLPDADALRKELKKIVSSGYAVDNCEHELGVYCVAAPVLDRDGAPLGALSISGSELYLRGQTAQYAALLRGASARITQML